MIKLGDINAQKVMLGTTPVQRVMLGTQQVWALTPPYLNVTPTSQSLPNTAGSFTIQIETNTNWYIDLDRWMSPDIGSGTGNAMVTINYNANTGDARTGGVAVVAGDIFHGGLIRSVQVIQEAFTPPYLSVTPESFYFRQMMLPQGFWSIKSNMSWMIVNNTSWVTMSPMFGEGDVQGTIRVAENSGIRTRECVVTFESIDKSIVVSMPVKQEFNGDINPPEFPQVQPTSNADAEINNKEKLTK